MRILVSGSSGLVGSRLLHSLSEAGHDVSRLVRSESPGGGKQVRWDPALGNIDAGSIEGIDAAVHLAGENIAARRWTAAQKARIRDSRVGGTRVLSTALANLKQPPKTLICASAIGFYGDRGSEELTEQSEAGCSFLSEVCQEWEAAADPARNSGIRVVHLRFGMILSSKGGALKRMLLPFKLCAGGVVGSGEQYMSWIALDDAVGAVEHALAHDDLSGPVNGVAPNPVTNREFTKTLGRVLGRPTILPMPAIAARLALGELAQELLLASARVLPKRLQETGYPFRYAELEAALKHVLGK